MPQTVQILYLGLERVRNIRVEFMLIYNETGLGRDQVKIWFCHHELAELLITT